MRDKDDPGLFEKKPWLLAPEETSQTLYVIYDHPLDYPAHFVLRRWHLYGGQLLVEMPPRLASSLEGIREHLPPDLVQFDRRSFNSDPVIIEVWGPA